MTRTLYKHSFTHSIYLSHSLSYTSPLLQVSMSLSHVVSLTHVMMVLHVWMCWSFQDIDVACVLQALQGTAHTARTSMRFPLTHTHPHTYFFFIMIFYNIIVHYSLSLSIPSLFFSLSPHSSPTLYLSSSVYSTAMLLASHVCEQC